MSETVVEKCCGTCRHGEGSRSLYRGMIKCNEAKRIKDELERFVAEKYSLPAAMTIVGPRFTYALMNYDGGFNCPCFSPKPTEDAP